ncbi:MAG: hypothetical protein RLZ37_377 [Actinomycetota bacterium]
MPSRTGHVADFRDWSVTGITVQFLCPLVRARGITQLADTEYNVPQFLRPLVRAMSLTQDVHRCPLRDQASMPSRTGYMADKEKKIIFHWLEVSMPSRTGYVADGLDE